MNEKILIGIQEARKETKKRNFKQSFDLAINLKNLDLKKPENKIKTEATLPHPISKDYKVGIFADVLIPKVKETKNTILIRKDEIENLGKDKKAGRKLAKQCRVFLAEASLMPLVGKYLGPILAVRGLMPKPIPPTIPNLAPLVENAQRNVRLTIKDNPVIHCIVGTEDMEDAKIAENIEAVLQALEAKLPRGKEQIKNIYIKTTMGKAIKVDMLEKRKK